MFFSIARFVQIIGAFAALASLVNGIDTITTSGRHFVNSVNGEKFWVKGTDYQPGGSGNVGVGNTDPLSDVEACARDIYLMQKLGVNAVRVYSVDPTLNHDACMSYLAAAGIYLILDVNSPLAGQSLNRYEPWTTSHVFAVIEAFKGYDNLLALFAGNEVVNDEQSAAVSPRYVKAVVRDMKNYIAAHVYRSIPIGYSAADDLKYRVELPEYLTCGDIYVDFYGVNTYQWCGDQTFTSSGYNTLTADYTNYSQPIIFSEFGCNLVLPRTFQEVTAIYSDEMTGVFSGGLAYEFTEEPNNYGLVDVNGTTATLLNDYVALQTQYGSVTVVEGTVAAVTRMTTCPAAGSYANLNGTNVLPDTPAADLIKNGISSSLYNAGKLITPSSWSTTYTVVDQNGNTVTNKAIDSSGYTASNPANGGSGTSGSQIGGGSSTNSTTKSDAGLIRFNPIMFGAVAVGVVAWNGLA